MTNKMKSTYVAKRGSSEITLPFDYGDAAGKGMDLDINDLKIPFLALLQQNSPECTKGDKKFIEGAETGLILNRRTGDMDESLLLNIAARETKYAEYVSPRVMGKNGGRGAHATNSEVVTEALRRNGNSNRGLKAKNGNDLVFTKTLYAITLDEDGNPTGFVVVGFSSTKLGPWREYWNAIDMAKVVKGTPVFGHLVRLGSFLDSNDKGNYANYTLEPANDGIIKSLADPNSEGYKAAETLFEGVSAGTTQADYSTEDGGAPVTSGDSTF